MPEAILSPEGAARRFAHEPPMSPYAQDGPRPGVLDDVPEVFRSCVEDPAFTDEDGMPFATACRRIGRGEPGFSAATTAGSGPATRGGAPARTPRPGLPERRPGLGVVPVRTYSPAALRSASTRSVRSHVKSGSSRPKWPYAAVWA